jgi:hypothetical protein
VKSESIVEWLGGALFSEDDLKLFIDRSLGFSQDAIDVVAGVAVLFAAALVLRKPVSSIWPLLIVLLLASLNASSDWWMGQGPRPDPHFRQAARDLLVTMAVPMLLMLSARWAPWLYRPPSGR